MFIFADTNIFFNNWHLSNANFQYLFNYLENTNSYLLVSDVVLDEVDNKFLSEYENFKSTIDKILRKSRGIINKDIDFNLDQIELNYSLKSTLNEKTENVIYFGYENVSNKELVRRAIKRQKPFKDEDKGFRDCLIWLSLLDLLTKYKDEDLAFINNNATDFFNHEKDNLHEDLSIDLTKFNIQNKFSVYPSLADFIKKEVGLNHKFTSQSILEEFIYPNEFIVEQELEFFIRSQSVSWFNDFIRQGSSKLKDLNYVTSFKFKILEGIEDPNLLTWNSFQENDFFIQLSFILRIISLEFTVPKIVYESRKNSIDKEVAFVEIFDDYVLINMFVKMYFDISYNFEATHCTVKDIAINKSGILL